MVSPPLEIVCSEFTHYSIYIVSTKIGIVKHKKVVNGIIYKISYTWQKVLNINVFY